DAQRPRGRDASAGCSSRDCATHENRREAAFPAASLHDALLSRLILGLRQIRLGRLGDVLETFATLLLIVVQVLERELLRWKHRDRLLLFGPEESGERAGLRHPVELVATRRETGARGDELADDDVLLEAQEPVLLAHDRGLGADARRLLEGGGSEEARGRERRLRDAEQ